MSDDPVEATHTDLMLEQIQKIAKVGGWEYDLQTGKLYWTDELWRLHGLEPHSVPLDQAFATSFFSEADRHKMFEMVTQSMTEGRPYSFEAEIRTLLGTRRFITGGDTLLQDGRPVRLYGATIDITDRWEMEQALRQSEARQILNDRLLALGRFAADIVHELNTPLSVIGLNLELLEMDLQKAGISVRNIPTLQRASHQLQELVTNLRQFSRGEARAQSGVALPVILQWVRRMLKLAAQEKGAAIELLLEPAPMAWSSEQKLMQLFTNLVTNALDAIPADGSGHIWLWLRASADGQSVLVDVQDNGPGVPPDLRDRIFAPFFTTKGDHGTGLGLAISHNIATQAGGSLELLSQGAQPGACFRVTLPVYVL